MSNSLTQCMAILHVQAALNSLEAELIVGVPSERANDRVHYVPVATRRTNIWATFCSFWGRALYWSLPMLHFQARPSRDTPHFLGDLSGASPLPAAPAPVPHWAGLCQNCYQQVWQFWRHPGQVWRSERKSEYSSELLPGQCVDVTCPLHGDKKGAHLLTC